MKKISRILAAAQLLFVVIGLFSQAVAQDQPTIQSINSINGFHDTFAAIERSFQNVFDKLPGTKPEKLVEAWEIASEGAFDADRSAATAEEQMEGKFSDAELRDLYEHFSSPLGRKVTALEIADTRLGNSKAKDAEGERIWAELATKDPRRLALYNRMLDGLDVVDFGEVVALNMTYGMVAGLFAAAGTPVTDEAMLALVKTVNADVRQTMEKTFQVNAVITYRDLSNEELEKYVEFLETPAGAHYYEISLQAFDRVLSKEAREFGNRLFAAFGMRKA